MEHSYLMEIDDGAAIWQHLASEQLALFRMALSFARGGSSRAAIYEVADDGSRRLLSRWARSQHGHPRLLEGQDSVRTADQG